MKICLKYRFPRKQEKRPSHRKERFSDFFTLALRQAQRPLLCLNRREGERFSVSIISFEAIGGGSPLDSDSLRLSGDVSFVLRDSLLEDFACREQRHFDLVGDSVVLVLTAVFMLRIGFPAAR